MYGKPIRLEIQSVAQNSRIFYGDEDISDVVRNIAIEAEAGDVTRVRLTCYKLDSEPWVIEGILLESESEQKAGA